MKELLSRYYQKVPDSIKELINPLAGLCKFMREYKFNVYLLKGESEAFYITYFTEPSPYFVKKFFNDAVITRTGKIYLWQLRNFINSHDTVMMDIHKTQAGFLKNGFLLPYVVRQVVDLDKPAGEKQKYELRRIKKFSYVISNDFNDLKMFYETMYVPYAKERFGDLAYLRSFDEVKKIFDKGELLLIALDGKYVAGSVNEIGNQVYFIPCLGVLDENYFKAGGLAAAWFYSFRRAKELHAKVADCGLSRPFFSDGVLNYKIKMGACICEDKSSDRRIYLKKMPNEPFICFKNKKLQAVLFAPDDILINKCRSAGLEFQIIENT